MMDVQTIVQKADSGRFREGNIVDTLVSSALREGMAYLEQK